MKWSPRSANSAKLINRTVCYLKMLLVSLCIVTAQQSVADEKEFRVAQRAGIEFQVKHLIQLTKKIFSKNQEHFNSEEVKLVLADVESILAEAEGPVAKIELKLKRSKNKLLTEIIESEKKLLELYYRPS